MIYFDTYNNFNKILNKLERRNFKINIFYAFFGMLLEMLGIALILPAIKYWQTSTESSSGSENSYDLLVTLGLIFALILIVKAIALSFFSHQRLKFIFGTLHSLQGSLLRHYINQPFAINLSRNSTSPIQKIIREAHEVVINGIQVWILLTVEILAFIGLSSALLYIDPFSSSLILAVFLTFGLVAYSISRYKFESLGSVRPILEETRLNLLRNIFDGIRTIKIYGRENYFYNIFTAVDFKINDLCSIVSFRFSLPRFWIELLAFMAFSIIILVNYSVNQSFESILPILSVFTLAALRIIPSVNRILDGFQQLKFANPAIALMASNYKLDLSIPIESTKKLKFNRKIQFDGVSFCYSTRKKDVFTNLSFTVNRGECLGIIGPSGVGKSTFIDLIMGLLVPQKGKITIDNSPIDNKLNIRKWQKQIGYVPQEIFILNNTLRHNIVFAIDDEDINEKKLLDVISVVQLDDLIQSLPDGLETILGDNGNQLSGGQRQRIGIARSLYHNPELLIFDEATSALDKKSEMSILKNIEQLKKTKTIIMVAHNKSSLFSCDKIIMLDSSGIIEVK